MHRDLDRLTARTFDLLVVGGGIYGLTIACDAAQRGLATALIERNDFGSGSSFNHLRTIHGGLRYLQTLDIGRARESVLERRTLARIAPAAVRPLPFVLPLPRSLTTGPLAMRAGFLLDAVVSRDKNVHVPESHRLPPGRVLSGEEARREFPALQDERFDAAAVWYDYVTADADRLTLSWGLAADSYGAALANYVEATSLVIEHNRVTGVRATDLAGGRELVVRARLIVNATGAAIDGLLGQRLATKLPLLKAMNLVTAREAPSAAIGGRTAAGKTLFMVPWKGRAVFGTWESSTPCTPGDLPSREDEILSFLADIKVAFPFFTVDRGDVTLVHRGVVPARVHLDGTAALEGHEQVVDHTRQGTEGLISVAGTKYTTARAVAERVVDRVVSKLGRAAAPCRTAMTPLPLSNLNGDRLLAHAATHEMVVTLEDAVVRRTPLGALGRPTPEAAAHAADIVGTALTWTADQRREELERLDGFYRL